MNKEQIQSSHAAFPSFSMKDGLIIAPIIKTLTESYGVLPKQIPRLSSILVEMVTGGFVLMTIAQKLILH